MSLQAISFTKMFIITNLISYVFTKSVKCEKMSLKRKAINQVCCIITAIFYVIMEKYLEDITTILFCLLIYGFSLNLLHKNTNVNFWFAYIISFCIAYIVYILAIVVSGVCYLIPGINGYSPICLISILLSSATMVIALFKFKRLKNGINFVKKFNGNKNTLMNVWLISVVVLFVYDLLQKEANVTILRLAVCGVMIISAIITYIISQLITRHYRNNIRDRNINIQKEEIDASEKIIGELKEQNLKLATTIHKYNHRLSSLENSIRKVMDSSSAEFAKELSVVLEQTEKVKAQFAEETKVKVALPTTNVVAIDNMLEYMQNECAASGIDFTFKLSDSIIPLLEKYISEDRFETLLGDHIKDAIIAINAKGEGYKGIMVLVGVVDNAYELAIYDTGVEFDISTLINLGVSPITTHKDEGGTGLGFMTTFETLKATKASLVIEEYDKRVTNYTKSVSIRFDGRCEYRVYSYRAEEIKEKCTGRKIVIKKI